jgi:NAD(P)-dependent dehydrogenase (short-subunit alcohol dehydrogenase family)
VAVGVTADVTSEQQVAAAFDAAAARVMAVQGLGGDIVYICSKNAVVAGPSNVAYGAAKADQAHQVRLLAAELGEHGNPVHYRDARTATVRARVPAQELYAVTGIQHLPFNTVHQLAAAAGTPALAAARGFP